MKEPIIIYENGALDIFDTRKRAELYLEPIDVENEEYIYYDSEGKILQAFVVKDSNGIDKIVITDGKTERYEEFELKRILIDFLNYLSYSKTELKQLSLNQLVKESLKFKTE